MFHFCHVHPKGRIYGCWRHSVLFLVGVLPGRALVCPWCLWRCLYVHTQLSTCHLISVPLPPSTRFQPSNQPASQPTSISLLPGQRLSGGYILCFLHLLSFILPSFFQLPLFIYWHKCTFLFMTPFVSLPLSLFLVCVTFNLCKWSRQSHGEFTHRFTILFTWWQNCLKAVIIRTSMTCFLMAAYMD